MASDTLNPRQRRFADLVAGGTAAAAAYAQVYGRTGRTAETASSRLMRNVEVRRIVAERRAGAARQVETDLAWVLRQLRAVAEDRDAPHVARVQALRTMAELHKDGHVPVSFALAEVEPLTAERLAVLASGALEAAVEGRASVKQVEEMLNLLIGTSSALVTAEQMKLLEAEKAAEMVEEDYRPPPRPPWFQGGAAPKVADGSG